MSLKPDWTIAPDDATHVLTTGPMWNGSLDHVGELHFVKLNMEGHYIDADRPYNETSATYALGAYGWLVLEARPEPQINLCCNNLCDKELLEKELKCKGAKEFAKCIGIGCTTITWEKELQEYIDYVMHEE